MEITPGRAPFSEEEDYTPLRKPKSVTASPTHSTGSGGGGGGGVGVGNVAQSSSMETFGRTVSPSTLSPFAKIFVPRFGGAAATGDNYQQQQQQPAYQQQTQQQQQQQYVNGYPQSNMQITSLTTSVQERLKIAGGGGGSGGSASTSSNTGNNKTTPSTTASTYFANNQPSSRPPHHNNSNKHQHYNHHQHMQQHQPQQQRYHNHHVKQHNQHHNASHHNHHHHNQHQHHHNHHHHHQQQQQQQRHNSNNTNSGAGASGAGGAADMETIALEYLQTVIQCLNQNPGQFDTIATRFLTIFDGMENNQYVLSIAMEDIFQESIQNPNFRYMGAKLYNLLHMLDLKKDSLFHTLLKCKLDYHQQEVAQYMQSNQQQKVRETALFLAELYMQLRGDDTRIHLIAENIVYSLKQLLSKESNDNVRCICLTLKLAGYDLTADCPAEMQEIITQLDGINMQSPGKYPLAANVISLQKNNWGRKVSNSLSEATEAASKTPEPLRTSDEPVFYGPDGRELTAEEADFLCGDAANASGMGGLDDDDAVGDDDLDLDPEMDEETERAYKEFCKLNANT